MKSIFSDTGEAPCMTFVGDFEAKYKAEPDPWEQSGLSGERAAYYTFSRRKLLSRLKARYTSKACGLEIGCGFGYLTHLLSQTYSMCGVDVSETALKRAKEMHPGIDFVRNDVTAEGFALPDQYHFVIIAQCWWYMLHELDTVLENCLNCLEPGGTLIIHQAFLKEQNYGRDIADGFDGALKLLMSKPSLRLVECHYDDSGLLVYYDGLMFFRKVEV